MFKKLLASLLLACGLASAAISVNMIFEVRTTGDNTYPGCFKEGATGTDFTLNAGSYTFTDLVIDGATNTKVTSASHNFVAADVGNCMRINSGTGFTTGVFEIVSVAANAATLDRSAGTLGSTGGTYHVGGQLATLAQLNTDMCSGCRAYIKATATYSVGSGVTFSFTNTNTLPAQISGYTTTRGDNGQFTLQASAAFGQLLAISNTSLTVRNLILDANSFATACLAYSNQWVRVENLECKGTASSQAAVLFNNNDGVCYRCYVHNVASTGAAFGWSGNSGNACIYCTADTLTGSAHTAFSLAGRGECRYCSASNATVANSDGFTWAAGASVSVDHCIVYNVARNGINIAFTNFNGYITNCVISTVTTGVNNTSGVTLQSGALFNDYNFVYNASSAAYTAITAGAHSTTLTADPFTSAGTLNFTLNNTAGGGAAVRTAGSPATLPGLTGTSYIDGGGFQHQDSGGSAVGGFVAP